MTSGDTIDIGGPPRICLLDVSLTVGDGVPPTMGGNGAGYSGGECNHDWEQRRNAAVGASATRANFFAGEKT